MYVNARAIIERDGPNGTEVLLQVAERPGFPPSLEFPGGRLEEFEPVLAALEREVLEETGLRVTRILDETERCVTTTPGSGAGGGASAQPGPGGPTEIAVECLRPFFVYQTTRGPVDSVGFFFRCHAEGELPAPGAAHGDAPGAAHLDAASGHRWMPVSEVAQLFREAPAAFHWLTAAALTYYLRWRGGSEIT